MQVREAAQWVTESPRQQTRHDRGIAFLFAILGTDAFPGCNGIAAICAHAGVSPRTMRFNLGALRTGYGILPPGLHREDAVQTHTAPLAAEEASEASEE